MPFLSFDPYDWFTFVLTEQELPLLQNWITCLETNYPADEFLSL